MPRSSFSLADNPLVNVPALPHSVPAYHDIQAAHYIPAMTWAIEKARQAIADIKTNPDTASFENTIEAIEIAKIDTNRISRLFTEQSALVGGALGDIEEEMEVLASDFGNELLFDVALFERVEEFHADAASHSLSDDQAALLNEIYNKFVRNGVGLSEEKRQRLTVIDQRLAVLFAQFNDNLKNAKAVYQKIVDGADLAGVPERVKSRYADAAEQAGHPGKYLIGLEPYPEEVMEYAENRELRREILTAFKGLASSGKEDNRDNALEQIKLRHEKAQILGYSYYADYVLADRMAGDRQTVEDFMAQSVAVYKPAAEQHLEDVKAYALKVDGLQDFQAWDMSYYERRLRAETFQYDPEELRPYLELEHVLEGLNNHVEKLFNIKLIECSDDYPKYHDDVRVYEVHDGETGALIGIHYADFYARPGEKEGGAWMEALRNRVSCQGHESVTITSNNLDIPRPVEGEPALLSMLDVETVFHEFGHALHGLMSRSNYPCLSYEAVKMDFVELQSQLQENWVHKHEVLNDFAIHHETGEVIPVDLVDRMKASSNFGSGFVGLAFIARCLLDVSWHSVDPETVNSVEAFEAEIMEPLSLFPQTGLISTKFHHIFGCEEYATGYYGYQWARALDADIFEEFQREGLYDQATAARIRPLYEDVAILPPDTLFHNVMGRDLNSDALFRREGLLPPESGDQAVVVPAGPTPS